MTDLINNKNPGPLYADGSASGNGYQDATGNFLNLAAYQFPHKKALLSMSARGLWKGRFIFQTTHGVTYYRNAAFNDLHKPKTSTALNNKFKQAVINWRTLSPEKKRALDSRASQLGKRCSGYNYFLFLWLKDHKDIGLYFP